MHTTNPYDESDVPIYHTFPEPTEHESRVHHGWNATTEYPYPFLPETTHGLEALSAAAAGDHYFQSASRQPNLSENLSPPIDPRLDVELSETCLNLFEPESDSTSHSFDPKTDEDVPFLLRCFSEGPGEWMDLFDLGSFFAVDVPLKAASCPVLLYAAIALSAKALGRIRITAQHPKTAGLKRTPAEWSHKARFYYDRAITQLRQALEHETRQVSVGHQSPQSVISDQTIGQSADMDRQTLSPVSSRHNTKVAEDLPRTDSDELIATTAILCVFEFLDASAIEWSRHLDGAKSLFEIAKDGTMPPTDLASSHNLTASLGPTTSTKGRRAVFWNICRQEMLNACKEGS